MKKKTTSVPDEYGSQTKGKENNNVNTRADAVYIIKATNEAYIIRVSTPVNIGMCKDNYKARSVTNFINLNSN
jgi:hypothetical protein